MRIETKKLSDLNPAEYNPRKDLKPGDPEFEKLKRSMETFGYVEPIIWNERTGNVVGGHQRLKVLEAMGKTEAECVIVDLDKNDEKALNVALNKISGDWDEKKLADLFSELSIEDYDVTITGFSPAELNKLMGEDISLKEDKAPEPREETDTKPGDLFILGEHRVMCGDSTKKADVEKLMGGVERTY